MGGDEYIPAMFPKCTHETEVMFILGNYIQQKDLRVDFMPRVLEAKLQYVKARSVSRLYINLTCD